ncbi:MAG: hypothetical protein ACRDTC_24265 [Pseudonocardiaceae bacterium]
MDAPFLVTSELHVGVVSMIGDRAYRLKKPVNLGFRDFNTRVTRSAVRPAPGGPSSAVTPPVLVCRSPAGAGYQAGIYPPGMSERMFGELLDRAENRCHG